jgi:hypothetical protein
MKQEEFYLKTSEYITKFKDGEKRYRESPLFNQVIQMLLRDVDPIDIIDQLIQTIENTQKAFEEYMIRDYPMSYIIKKNILYSNLKNNKYEETI